VAVIGGGDSAVTEALFLTRIASKVTLVHRRGEFRAAPTLVTRLRQAENAELRLGRVPVEIEGRDRVESLVIRDPAGGDPERVQVDGVFIYVGLDPETGFLKGHIDLDDEGYIITDELMRTRAPGVYAAGDVRAKDLRQVVTAAADGAVAAVTAERDLAED
jgi:thioredoxin reductase (NADPH)